MTGTYGVTPPCTVARPPDRSNPRTSGPNTRPYVSTRPVGIINHTYPGPALLMRIRNPKVSRICIACGKTDLIPHCWAKRGGKYCSHRCEADYRTKPLIDRFFNFIGRKQPSGCIPWVGAVTWSGYGRIGIKGDGWAIASRVSYELFVGEIPEGMWVLHRCDNPPCINPTHLFIGTRADNVSDMMSKTRQARHEGHPGAKLTMKIANIIRELYADGEYSYRTLRDELGLPCSPEHVGRIVRNEVWSEHN